MRRLTAIGSLITAGLLAAACSAGAGPSGNGTAAAKNVVTISNENGALWTCQFSPFNGSDTLLSVGFVYETLAYDNPLQSGKTTPMLASSWQWGAGNKSITFTIRKGVKFSDGTPMSAADVVYTFNLLKKYPALDLTGVWSVLSSVTQSGSDQVVMDFKSAAVPAFYFIAGQTPIVPEHIWSKIANPVTYTDSNPIGTGPYVVNPCTKANITYTANKHYWQPGEPHIAKVEYPAYTSNNTANDQLATGQAQWGSQYIPGIKSFYTAKSPNFHYWFPPTVNVSLVPNLKNSLLSNVKVREAMSYAINRSKVSTIGESGYEPPANQAGIVTPTFSSWLDTSAVAKFGNAYDPARAKQLLASAGFKLGSDGIMANAQGQKLSFSVINIGDYSDWVASMQVVTQDLKAVGIQLTPDNLTNTEFDADLYYGKYQLAFYDQQTFGPSPYYELRNWLDSAGSAPVGKLATTNYERYSNPATDALFDQYAASTSSSQQHALINQVEQVMLNELPIIPVVQAVDWFQYDTTSITGWPTPGNPYAQPSAYAYPDMEQVLLHLRAK
ncbi:MAG TPA: ABC transporter substrate-binding protein [Streptosporangiaceae bacterium]|jgi:peptide/nickel transport system substrate-binding protein